MICQPDMPYLDVIRKLPLTVHIVANHGPLDVLCIKKLHQLLDKINPTVTIGHGNRALDMLRPVFIPRKLQAKSKILGVAQNYKLHRFGRLDGAFASTRELAGIIANKYSLPENSIFHQPNMVRPPSSGFVRQPWHRPPIIGSLGRFVTKKGFEFFINSLALLKQRGFEFSAVLAGDGELKPDLMAQAEKLGLKDILQFPGWAEDKTAFYSGIDIFCLPSLHEPFGIVALEAMIHKLPMVTSDSEGPCDFLIPDEHALFVPKANAAAMADSLAVLLNSPARANQLAESAVGHAEKFTVANSGRKILSYIESWQ
jgi:glycosyltransferase involved in cell wall biosynthesis